MLNSYSLNVSLEDASVESVFGDIPVLVMGNDDGAFYVPSFGVDQIGDLAMEGYDVFLTRSNDYTLSVDGLAVDQTTGLTIEAFKLNM